MNHLAATSFSDLARADLSFFGKIKEIGSVTRPQSFSAAMSILAQVMDRSMNADSWGRMAEWYDAKQGDTGDSWHRTLIDPLTLSFQRSFVGPVAGSLGSSLEYPSPSR